jgi:predicted metal-binding protein
VTQSFEALEQEAVKLGAVEAKLIDARAVVIDPRALLKCRFGCNRWGKYWTCQPNTGITLEQFQQSLNQYSRAIIIKTLDPKTGQDVTLEIEKKAMLEYGAPMAFAMVLCVQCETCSFPDPCRYPHLARPAMDGLGVDVIRTVEPLGFKVEFDVEGKLLPSWFSMVLLD